ncbi:hypothetical protein E0493_05180 [Roseomonas sp. M0104]|uniref:Uncharacterized protein n=1 Tax=Teichococcus coralli TaxID=2545983 RepID=A0A845B7R5_9PROT|nr:hypothetical protein [Pseudoroseomonas coralli]MXP62745.1 hypothetical protein [Pseudoroseomonas coralli]
MGRGRPKSVARKSGRQVVDPGQEISQLRRELEEARALLRNVELNRTEAGSLTLARRLATLEEERQVARGLAVEAALARSKVEAELKALRDAIEKAPGVWGWLLRRARRRLR